MKEFDEQSIHQLAQQYFTPVFIDDEKLLAEGYIGTPIMQLTPEKTVHGWFVPVIVEKWLAGFFLFSRQGDFLRFSTFARQQGKFNDCPELDYWLNRNTIIKSARTIADQDETLEPPFLSYDNSPERIAWIVETNKHGNRGLSIMITGTYVYRKN